MGRGKSRAYRLVEAWPLAERLSPIGDRLAESPRPGAPAVRGRHGQDAAATVYQAALADAGSCR